ncbi:uncharacterized protein LOC107498271 isoform X3 [Rousettus aegyptiacus]|uniref:uncharacterized protein LOC107498271 isoform X3 n=1 Tax=Rousettus aegyptiacus TaxID=9407 RepID=UPI00168D96BA|nr:uncharacterized protein LOC107498271 isoform X3 [Rousettus aegyptiacus]
MMAQGSRTCGVLAPPLVWKWQAGRERGSRKPEPSAAWTLSSVMGDAPRLILRYSDSRTQEEEGAGLGAGRVERRVAPGQGPHRTSEGGAAPAPCLSGVWRQLLRRLQYSWKSVSVCWESRGRAWLSACPHFLFAGCRSLTSHVTAGSGPQRRPPAVCRGAAASGKALPPGSPPGAAPWAATPSRHSCGATSHACPELS